MGSVRRLMAGGPGISPSGKDKTSVGETIGAATTTASGSKEATVEAKEAVEVAAVEKDF